MRAAVSAAPDRTRAHAWIRRHPRLAGGLSVLALLLTIEWGILDRWQLTAQVKDSTTGNNIPGAWILFDLLGEKPLVRLPIPPHPRHRTRECIATRAIRTDVGGRFKFSELMLNRALANKSAHIIVFKPGLLTSTKGIKLSASLLASSPFVMFNLAADDGRRRETNIYPASYPAGRLPLVERTYGQELFSAEGFLLDAASACTVDVEVLSAAMQHILQIAETFDERERARAACGYVEKRLASNHRAPISPAAWPFQCDNLPFKKEPTAEVVAVEAQLTAKRRAWRQNNSAGGGY